MADLLAEANRQLSLAVQESEAETEQVKLQCDKYFHERTTLRSAVAQYRERASRDPLTGLLNRGALLESMVQCQRQIAETKSAITVFFMDIDNFKQVNDERGHSFGDEVLRMISTIVMDSVCQSGSAGRYGGEDFVIIMPGLSKVVACRLASQLVLDIRGMDYAGLGLNEPVTCSLGAVWGWLDLPPEQLIALADKLMYEAKRAGKDQFIFKAVENVSKGQPSIPEDKSSDPHVQTQPSRNHGSETSIRKIRKIAEGLHQEYSSSFVNTRKESRNDLMAPCRLAYLKDASLTVVVRDAFVRNISAGGLSLLTVGRMIRGDLIEASVTQNEGERFYAGLISFCRHITDDIYEIGVQIIDQDDQPIFSQDPLKAVKGLNWINEVIQERHGDSYESRRSA